MIGYDPDYPIKSSLVIILTIIATLLVAGTIYTDKFTDYGYDAGYEDGYKFHNAEDYELALNGNLGCFRYEFGYIDGYEKWVNYGRVGDFEKVIHEVNKQIHN